MKKLLKFKINNPFIILRKQRLTNSKKSRKSQSKLKENLMTRKLLTLNQLQPKNSEKFR